jgi:signal transduction histidine kinase
MKQRARRFRNVHAILTLAAGLVILVSVALGGLGWRLLQQEEALQQQRARDALEGKANILQTQFFSKMGEAETLLRGLGSSLPPGAGDSFGKGAIVVAMKTGVETQPPGQLMYLPFVPSSRPLDAALFDESQKLEFQSRDFSAASAALAALADRQGQVRAEALFRLARVHKKNGRIKEALATYANLKDERTLSPALEEPYGLVSRLQRAELLKESGQVADAQAEAAALIDSLNAGQWAINKGTHHYYFRLALDLAGHPPETSAPAERLVVAETVGALWDEWRQFARSGSQSLTKQLHSSGPIPVLTLVNANPERLVAVIYPGQALRNWIPDPGPGEDAAGIRVDLVASDGRSLTGTPREERPALRVVRTLSPASLPWQLDVTSAVDGASRIFASERRNYLVFALAGIVLMVALACYAMARGVLREAAAGRLQSDFVSAVSHEFRSPLTTLRQLTELLAEGRIVEEGRRRQYFSVLQKETSRLHQLVEDLLDFGRMEAGRRQYRPEALDLATVVRDTVQQYSNEAAANGHSIDVAPQPGPLVVEADREALQRVVRNLLENAVKYSPEARTVWVETEREGRFAVLRVRDQGIGIPDAEKKRIFEKFVRGDAAKRAAIPGTGIGLAMVHEIVRVHHGEVGLTSEVGSGSTFTVRLPLSRAPGAAEVQEPQAVHGSFR